MWAGIFLLAWLINMGIICWYWGSIFGIPRPIFQAGVIVLPAIAVGVILLRRKNKRGAFDEEFFRFVKHPLAEYGFNYLARGSVERLRKLTWNENDFDLADCCEFRVDRDSGTVLMRPVDEALRYNPLEDLLTSDCRIDSQPDADTKRMYARQKHFDPRPAWLKSLDEPNQPDPSQDEFWE